jgi:cystathionine beta-lyase/cystathionine gamma-synthase
MTHFETDAIHGEREVAEPYGAVTMPIFQTSTFRLDEPTNDAQWVYSRGANPTRAALEASLAKLEQGTWAYAFATGMAATSAVTSLLTPGDHMIATNDVYGGSFRLFDKLLANHGITVSFVDTRSVEAVAAACQPTTRLLWIETPSNPHLGITPLREVSELAHARDMLVAVDNTFATPYLQRPLEHGVDLVVHSTTKYLGGHSDVLGGAVIGNDAQLGADIGLAQRGYGAVPAPMDCFLILRGIKTLAVRMDRQIQTTAKVVEFLERRPEVTKVLYPGHGDNSPDYLDEQMSGAGAMVSFFVAGGSAAARQFLKSLRIFSLAMSLGGVESLCELPATMTHIAVAGSACEVPEDLVRLSIGLEHEDDLIADLAQALDQVG